MGAAEDAPNFVWNGVRRVVRVAGVSLGVLMAGSVADAAMLGRPVRAAQVPSSGIVAGAQSGGGDVEAAAVTLGAVTVGGLFMRAIINSRKDDKEEQRRLEVECKRLEEEETERALRVQRRKMEQVEGGSANQVPDDELMSDFMKRVQSLGKPEDDVTESTDKDHMRQNPIPDRGTGSMLLDRPSDGEDSDEPQSSLQAEGSESGEAVNQEGLDMLKRMWNLDSNKE